MSDCFIVCSQRLEFGAVMREQLTMIFVFSEPYCWAYKHFLQYRSLRKEITGSRAVTAKWHVTSSIEKEPMNTIYSRT